MELQGGDEMFFKRSSKVFIEVTAEELRMMQESLIALRNELVAAGRYTDPVDEMLTKLIR